MRTTKRVAVPLGLLFLFAVNAANAREPVSVRPLDLTRPPTENELRAAGQLGGPLHPTRDGADTARERRIRLDFGRAIQAWNDHDYGNAVKLLRQHIDRFPDSPWAAEAELHLGCDAQYQGRYHEARSTYTALIERFKSNPDPDGRMMAHKARLRLAGLEVLQYDFAAAGEQFRVLKAESPDWRHRTYASHWIQRLGLYRSNEPSLLTCGTQALAHVLEVRGHGGPARSLREEIPGATQGQSVDDLIRLARRHGQTVQARRMAVADLASVPLPVIVHLEGSPSGKSGHFWVVEQAQDDFLRLYDPQSGRRFRQSTAEFAREWGGYALVLSGRRDLPGVAVDEREDSATRGGCCGAPTRESNLGAPGASGGGTGTGDGRCAPVWDVNMINMNFYVADMPLWFTPPYGPPVEIRLSYNSQSAIAYHEPFGAKWQFNYATYMVIDTGGSVTVFMPDGRRDTYTPDGAGGFTPPVMVHDELVAVGAERYELRLVDGTVFVYSMPRPAGGGLVTQLFLEVIRDTRGLTLAFSYDIDGRLVTIADALGRLSTLTYDGANHVTRIADPFGRTAEFAYDADGNLAGITDMGGYVSTFTYDADRYITGIDGTRGRWQFRTEPADGIPKWPDAYPPPGEPMWANYRITVTNPMGDPYEYYYYGGCETGFGCAGYSWYVSPRDYIPWRTTEINNLVGSAPKTRFLPTITAGGFGAIAEIRTPEGRRTVLSYDSGGNVSQVTDPAGHTTGYVYGDRGQVLSMTDPKGAVTTFTYAPNDVDLVAIVDGLGTTSIAYNAAREVTSITDRLDHATTFGYNSLGQLTSVTDPLGVATSFTYGAGAEPERVTRGGQILLQRTFDARGREATRTDATGLTVTIAHDDLDRVTGITFPDGRSRQFTYSGCCVDRLDSTTERSGQTTTYGYDALSRRTEIHHPDGSVTRFGYDKNGNRTQWTDPAGNVTRIRIDLDDLPVQRIFADATSESYGRDEDGLIDRVVNARGQVNLYSYDPAHRLTGLVFDDGTAPVAYTYDLFGRLVTRQDAIGTTQYTYDAESRRTEIDGPWPSDIVSMQYDAAGRLTRVAVEGGTPTDYGYDLHGRLGSVEQGSGSFAYGYTGPNPLPASLTRPNGVRTSYVYDSLNRLQEVAHRRSDLAVIARDTYTYDTADRLAGATTEGGLPAPAFTSRLATSQFDGVNRLLSSTDPPRAYGYDGDGSQTSGYTSGGAPFAATYDSENHIRSLEYTNAGGHLLRSEYGYDGDGWLVRIVERDNGTVARERRFVRGPRLFLQERDGNNAVVAEYAWDPGSAGGIGGLLKRGPSGQDYFYLNDGAGNVTAVVDGAQQRVAAYRYDPFGRLEGESGTLAQEFRFSTKFFDARSGLSYFGFRFYAAETGRWMTRDPLRERGGPNLYTYTENDPLNLVDPWGLAAGKGRNRGPGGAHWGGRGSYADPDWNVCKGGGLRNYRWGGRTWGQKFKAAVGRAWTAVGGGADGGDTGSSDAVVGVRG